MKKLFVLLALAVLFFSPAVVLAQTQPEIQTTAEDILETSTGMLPDSPFYGFKRFGEGIQLFLTFDQLEKAKLKYRLAQLRLAEAETMARLNKIQLAENMLREYENGINEIETDEKAIAAAGRNTSAIADLVGNNTYRHILVLQNVYGKVPDSAKPAIRKVIEKSMERQSEIVERFADMKFVNITIIVDNQTITKEVPAKLAEKFLEKVEIEDREDLKELLAEKLGMTEEKIKEQINEVKEKLSDIESNITADVNTTGLNRVIGQAKTHLKEAEAALSEGKYREAYHHAILAEKAVHVAEKILERAENIEKIIAKKLELKREEAQQQIEDARMRINQTEQKLAEKNITNTTANKLIEQAKKHLNKSEEAFNNSKYGEAFGQAVAAETLAKSAERIEEQRKRVCAQIITPAMRGGICKEFPTSCIPEGWEKVEKCPVNSGDIYLCEKDSDCISIKIACCYRGCDTTAAINNKYKDYWNKKQLGNCRGVVCPAVIYPECSKLPVCLDGRCRLISE